jgi:hypothetical protein
MKFSRLVVVSFVMGALLVGCGGGDESGDESSNSTTSTTAGSAAAAAGPACTSDDLSASIGDKESVKAGQFRVQLAVRNDGSSACTMQGNPVIYMIGPASPAGSTYYVHPAKADRPVVTLQPKERAVAMFTYLTSDTASEAACTGGKPWTPTNMSVSPEDGSWKLTIPWNGDTFNNCMAAVANPGDFVTPFAHE